jgi:ElaB/YqjD/DUF883 family membrane-anchored ribosome-binding protein
MDSTTTEKLVSELRAVVRDAEELLRVTAAEGGARVEEASEKAREAAREIDEQVRKNPWAAVGIAAGVGILLGLLLSRK